MESISQSTKSNHRFSSCKVKILKSKNSYLRVKEIFEQDYDPDTLLADSSSAIRF